MDPLGNWKIKFLQIFSTMTRIWDFLFLSFTLCTINVGSIRNKTIKSINVKKTDKIEKIIIIIGNTWTQACGFTSFLPGDVQKWFLFNKQNAKTSSKGRQKRQGYRFFVSIWVC